MSMLQLQYGNYPHHGHVLRHNYDSAEMSDYVMVCHDD